MRLPAQGGICASRTAEGVRYKKVACNATPKKKGDAWHPPTEKNNL